MDEDELVFSDEEQQRIDDLDESSRQDSADQLAAQDEPDSQFTLDTTQMLDDISEGSSLTGSTLLADMGLGSDGGASYSSNYASRQGVGYVAPAVADKSWVDTVKSFWGDAVNEKGGKMKLIELGFGAIASMAKDSAAKEAAAAKAKADMALSTHNDGLVQAANQRFSASISGLAPVQRNKAKPLTRLDGSRVFTSSGLINQGVK